MTWNDYTSQAFRNMYERMQQEQQWYTGSWSTKKMTPRDEIIFGLCYGAAYNKFPELELWDREKRIRLPQEVKNKVVEYLKVCYKYYDEKYKDEKFSK